MSYDWVATHVGREIANVQVIPPDFYPESYEDVKLSTEEPTTIEFTIRVSPTPEFEEWAKTYGVEYEMSITTEDGAMVHFQNKEAAMWFKMRWT